jgi:hypothetical protein
LPRFFTTGAERILAAGEEAIDHYLADQPGGGIDEVVLRGTLSQEEESELRRRIEQAWSPGRPAPTPT